MYHFSRSIYRELAADILEEERHCEGPSNHERVLRSCEQCVERLVPFAELGARDFLLAGYAPYDWRSLELIAGEVAPALRRELDVR